MFRYIPGTDTNWQCYLANASNSTVYNSGVAVSNSVPVTLGIVESGTAFSFYINGVQVCGAMAQTNRPTSTAQAIGTGWLVNIEAGGVAKNVQVQFLFHAWNTL